VFHLYPWCSLSERLLLTTSGFLVRAIPAQRRRFRPPALLGCFFKERALLDGPFWRFNLHRSRPFWYFSINILSLHFQLFLFLPFVLDLHPLLSTRSTRSRLVLPVLFSIEGEPFSTLTERPRSVFLPFVTLTRLPRVSVFLPSLFYHCPVIPWTAAFPSPFFSCGFCYLARFICQRLPAPPRFSLFSAGFPETVCRAFRFLCPPLRNTACPRSFRPFPSSYSGVP